MEQQVLLVDHLTKGDKIMGSSQRYFEHARECSRWAAKAEESGTQDLLFEMAKVWINVALVESDVAKQAAVDRFVAKRTLHP